MTDIPEPEAWDGSEPNRKSEDARSLFADYIASLDRKLRRQKFKIVENVGSQHVARVYHRRVRFPMLNGELCYVVRLASTLTEREVRKDAAHAVKVAERLASSTPGWGNAIMAYSVLATLRPSNDVLDFARKSPETRDFVYSFTIIADLGARRTHPAGGWDRFWIPLLRDQYGGQRAYGARRVRFD